ncbi:hypothetical protein [Nocardioides sp.]|uniref:hypothetical protein n=1 Tax=Nocardioides sp. TaxID=35761 RepID=UPI003568DBA9
MAAVPPPSTQHATQHASQRPVLRPGLRVVRRDDRHLQIGIDPPHRLIVPDHPDVRRLLADVRCGQPPTPDSPEGTDVLARLHAHGLLVDGDLLATAQARATDPASAAATFAQFGPEAGDRLAARRSARVLVLGESAVRDPALRLLAAAGVPVLPPDAAEDDTTVTLVLSEGEVRRETVDAFVQAARAHLVLVCGAFECAVGPFVVPGVTACLRCVDAHLGHLDPRRATVVEQVAGSRAPGDPVARDPSLVAMAIGWAVRDVVGYLDGDLPSLWSSTVRIDAGLALTRRTWQRHPHCGCSWGDALTG